MTGFFILAALWYCPIEMPFHAWTLLQDGCSSDRIVRLWVLLKSPCPSACQGKRIFYPWRSHPQTVPNIGRAGYHKAVHWCEASAFFRAVKGFAQHIKLFFDNTARQSARFLREINSLCSFFIFIRQRKMDIYPACPFERFNLSKVAQSIFRKSNSPAPIS